MLSPDRAVRAFHLQINVLDHQVLRIGFPQSSEMLPLSMSGRRGIRAAPVQIVPASLTHPHQVSADG